MRKRVWILLVLLMAAALVADRLVTHEGHPNSHWWSHVPGFYGLFGLIGCIGLIVFSKWLGRKWLQKGEDYYGGE